LGTKKCRLKKIYRTDTTDRKKGRRKTGRKKKRGALGLRHHYSERDGRIEEKDEKNSETRRISGTKKGKGKAIKGRIWEEDRLTLPKGGSNNMISNSSRTRKGTTFG